MSVFYGSKSVKMPTNVEVAGVVILILMALVEWWAVFLTVAPLFVITVIVMRSNAKYDQRSRELQNKALQKMRQKDEHNG